ncbi:biotin-dependent carboxyltransferase family protein [Mariniluteicoccus endophyticus]
MSLAVDAVGPLVLVEDLGRHGYGHLGISPSGALDRRAHALANRLVGNPEDLATLEVLMGGLRVRGTRELTVALTGAPTPVTLDGVPQALLAPFRMQTGQLLALGVPEQGLRTYLAVRGGIDVAPVLGSRSTDPTTGVGPPRVAAGDVLPVGEPPATPIPRGDASMVVHRDGELTLRVVWGPRDDWFTQRARESFLHSVWETTAQGDRVGVRLAGEPLERARADELASEGIVRGAVQVPRDGQPLVFLADHPTTGGYPVIAVVVDADVDRLAQARPGTRVRFSLDRQEA